MRLATEDVNERRKTSRCQRSKRLEIKLAASERLETAQRDDDERGAGGNLLDRRPDSMSSREMPSAAAISSGAHVGPSDTGGARNHATSPPSAEDSKVTDTGPTARFSRTGPDTSGAT